MGVNPVIAIFFGGDFMVKVSDYVVYNYDVCKVIVFNIFNGKDYYFLNSLSDSSLKIYVPVNNSSIRGVISRNGVSKLV